MTPLSTRQAADMLHVTTRRVVALIAAGKLRATWFGRDWAIDPASVRAYARTPRLPGNPGFLRTKVSSPKRRKP